MAFNIQSFIEDQKIDTYTFPLHRSSYGKAEPERVTCKVIDLFEKASLGHLPKKLQEEFFADVESVQREIKRMQRNTKAGGDSLMDKLAENEKLVKQADKYCVAGWLDPKVVDNQADEDLANRVMWIGRVKRQDRIAYMVACMDADGEQAKHFQFFRDGEDEGSVSAGEAVPASTNPAIFPVENAGERV